MNSITISVKPVDRSIRSGAQLHHKENHYHCSKAGWVEAKTAFGRLTPEDQQRFDTRAQVIIGLAKAQRDIERSQHPTKRARLEDGIAKPTHLELEDVDHFDIWDPKTQNALATIPAHASVHDDALPLGAQPIDVNVALNSHTDYLQLGRLPGLDSAAMPLSVIGGTADDDIEPFSASILQKLYDRKPPFGNAFATYTGSEQAVRDRCTIVELGAPFPETISYSLPCNYCCKRRVDTKLQFHNRFCKMLAGLAKSESKTNKASDIGTGDLTLAFEVFQDEMSTGAPEMIFFAGMPAAMGKYYRFPARQMLQKMVSRNLFEDIHFYAL